MALTLTPVTGGKSRLAADQIDADVAMAVEEAFKYLQEPGHETERLEVDLGSREEGETFLHAARSYAYHRDPRLVVTGNPFAKGARFRVDLYVVRDPAMVNGSEPPTV